jgi:hypothetical protein
MHLIYEYPYLLLAQTAFTFWMLLDVYRRPADSFWFYVILFLQPFGAWVYFLLVKVKDFHQLNLHGWPAFQSRPSLAELRYKAEHLPSLASHLALGERLIERGEHAQAVPHLEAALKPEPEHCQILYNLAVCHTHLGHPELAVPLLQKLIRRDHRWSNYTAWHLLVEAKAKCGDQQGALETCRELVRVSPTLQHQCLLAEHLVAVGQPEEARRLLEDSLQAHHFHPAPIRRRNRRWASEARRLQKRIATPRQ